MAAIGLASVTKVYGRATTPAVADLSLEVADGEFMVLVGPSGCGKTTALRMVAGLEAITSGTITIGDRVVNACSPRERDVAMVFQNYALYPHMTVAQNIGFSLRLAKVPRAEIARRVQEAAAVLGLGDHLDRRPGQLSGGQRQRVAMGRAIVREPAAFLMDEPLSNLDAKLRVQMRAEISRIQRRLGVATLYVTHDQTEAMTMGDRVAVLRAGRLQQCDAPQVLYDRPANLFVAAFIGSPSMNLYEAVVTDDGTHLALGDQHLDLPEALRPGAGRPVVAGIRPEDLADAARRTPAGPGRVLEGDVELVEALGAEKLVHFRIGAGRVTLEASAAPKEDPGGAEALFAGEIANASVTTGVARVEPASTIAVGTRARFVVDVDQLHLFDPHSGEALGTASGPR